MASLSEADAARVAAVQRAHAAGDLESAVRLADAALRDGIAHPLLLGILVSRREQEGRFDEALALLRQLDDAVPGNLAIVRGIAFLLLRLDRLNEAAAAFGAALAIAPRDADLLAQRGLTWIALARIGEARRDLEAATAIDAGHAAALDGLAGLALRRGETEEARRLAEAVLTRRPGTPTALLTRAGADLAGGRAAEAEAAARTLAANAAADPRDRATAFGLLGDALDAQGRFAEAFAAWREANDLLHSHYRPTFAQGPGTLGLVRTMAETLAGRRIAASASGPAGPARRHVFLLGFPRSGTTLIEQVLEEHPDVVTMPERDCLAEGSREWLADAARLEALLAAPDAALEPARAAYWWRVEAEGLAPDGRVFVDKNPFNSFRLPLIARLFPDAVILLATRDPRDVLLSCFRHRFQMSPAAWQLLTLEGAADLYAATMALVTVCETTFDLTHHPVPLEAIVADFDGETKRICEAIGIGWTPALRDFAAHAGARDVATPSGPQLVRGLNARGIGKWRDYAAELAPVLPGIAPWIARFAPN
ncbi:MAG TPA: sulfotransferase [Allosphingosinicella sp.]|nr:sulfotransferase [Allosphingosinicella sp.]